MEVEKGPLEDNFPLQTGFHFHVSSRESTSLETTVNHSEATGEATITAGSY